MIEHVGTSISASLEIELLWLARVCSICCYNVCVHLQNTSRRSRRHARLGRTLFRQLRARLHAVLATCHALSQLVFLAALKAPRREWVRPRYIVRSVSAYCGRTIFVRFQYWIETATTGYLSLVPRPSPPALASDKCCGEKAWVQRYDSYM